LITKPTSPGTPLDHPTPNIRRHNWTTPNYFDQNYLLPFPFFRSLKHLLFIGNNKKLCNRIIRANNFPFIHRNWFMCRYTRQISLQLFLLYSSIPTFLFFSNFLDEPKGNLWIFIKSLSYPDDIDMISLSMCTRWCVCCTCLNENILLRHAWRNRKFFVMENRWDELYCELIILDKTVFLCLVWDDDSMTSWIVWCNALLLLGCLKLWCYHVRVNSRI